MNNKTKIFINLTNGIEAIPHLEINDINFIRIQSCHCERQKFDSLIEHLDYNLLMYLALGYNCIIYDFGVNSDESKAMYTGSEWIKYVLNLRWFDNEIIPIVKGKNVQKFYNQQYQKLSYKIKRKIDYFKKFIITDNIHLSYISQKTKNDNNIDYYVKIIKDNYY